MRLDMLLLACVVGVMLGQVPWLLLLLGPGWAEINQTMFWTIWIGSALAQCIAITLAGEGIRSIGRWRRLQDAVRRGQAQR